MPYCICFITNTAVILSHFHIKEYFLKKLRHIGEKCVATPWLRSTDLDRQMNKKTRWAGNYLSFSPTHVFSCFTPAPILGGGPYS